MEVSSADKYETAFKEAIKAGSSALLVGGSSLDNANQKRIAELATRNRLPAICPRADYITNGGLMSHGADREEPYIIDKILKGAKPADIPVQQPTKFELVIKSQDCQADRTCYSSQRFSKSQQGNQMTESSEQRVVTSKDVQATQG